MYNIRMKKMIDREKEIVKTSVLGIVGNAFLVAFKAFVGFLAGTLTVFWMNFYTSANFLLFGFTAIAVAVLVALLLSFVWPEHRSPEGYTWVSRPKE